MGKSHEERLDALTKGRPMEDYEARGPGFLEMPGSEKKKPMRRYSPTDKGSMESDPAYRCNQGCGTFRDVSAARSHAGQLGCEVVPVDDDVEKVSAAEVIQHIFPVADIGGKKFEGKNPSKKPYAMYPRNDPRQKTGDLHKDCVDCDELARAGCRHGCGCSCPIAQSLYSAAADPLDQKARHPANQAGHDRLEDFNERLERLEHPMSPRQKADPNACRRFEPASDPDVDFDECENCGMHRAAHSDAAQVQQKARLPGSPCVACQADMHEQCEAEYKLGGPCRNCPSCDAPSQKAGYEGELDEDVMAGPPDDRRRYAYSPREGKYYDKRTDLYVDDPHQQKAVAPPGRCPECDVPMRSDICVNCAQKEKANWGRQMGGFPRHTADCQCGKHQAHEMGPQMKASPRQARGAVSTALDQHKRNVQMQAFEQGVIPAGAYKADNGLEDKVKQMVEQFLAEHADEAEEMEKAFA